MRWLREQPDQHELVLAAYYDDPLAGAADRYWRSDEWHAVCSYLPPTRGRALDVGAGRGIASFALAREGFSVTALEPDASALVGAGAIRALAGETALPIEVTQEFSEGLPFDDASFDLVFARAVLHHTRDLAAACREFHRVLKPGGRLLAVREHVISRREDLRSFLAAHPLHHLYGGEHAYQLAEYQQAIAAAGFRSVETLRPFDSAINLAPHTLASVRQELAARASAKLPGTERVLNAALRRRKLWAAARAVLNRVDRRPGHLFSFVAER